MIKTNVSLVILEFDFDPGTISSIIKIDPDRTWIKGDLIDPHATIKRKSNGWELKSKLSEDVEFEAHIEWILNKILFQKKRIKKICKRYYCEISCAIYFDDYIPSISLTNEMMKVLSDYYINIDFDLIKVSLR